MCKANEAKKMSKKAVATRRDQKRVWQGSKWITARRRLAIYLRDGMTCLLCNKDLHGANVQDITLDHIVCWIDGGSDSEINLYTCCRSCNSSRGDKKLSQVATPEALAIIRRNTRRKLAAYLLTAKGLLDARATKLEC